MPVCSNCVPFCAIDKNKEGKSKLIKSVNCDFDHRYLGCILLFPSTHLKMEHIYFWRKQLRFKP
jgi:hypothetical protein